jgi:predicted O-methyltransferase YrrM
MALEDAMGTVMQWGTATEALAAVGAQLRLAQSGQDAPPEILDALRAVATAGGLGDIDQLPPPQQAMFVSLIRMFLHQALDVIENPERAPGWTFTNPVILDGWGRGSAMVPAQIAAAHADLADVSSFLDVGTGVGLLAVSAAGVWPNATIVGIDPWDASLQRARANVEQSQLGERITIRQQDLASLDDVDTYDCVWVPTFFLSEQDLKDGVAASVRALTPGGWLVLGRMRQSPDPLVGATAALRTTRAGGTSVDNAQAMQILNDAGCVDVHVAEAKGPSPIELVLGRRPT